jgi:hypothetical protein
MVAHWYNEPKIGYALFNLNGIAIYEPDYAQEETNQASSEEARQEGGQAGPEDQEASSEEAGLEEASSEEGYQEGEA